MNNLCSRVSILILEAVNAGASIIRICLSTHMETFTFETDKHMVQLLSVEGNRASTTLVTAAMQEEVVERIYLVLLPFSMVACTLKIEDGEVLLHLPQNAERPLKSISLLFPHPQRTSEEHEKSWTLETHNGPISVKAYIQASISGIQLLYLNHKEREIDQLDAFLNGYGHLGGYLIMICCPHESYESLQGERVSRIQLCDESFVYIKSCLQEALSKAGLEPRKEPWLKEQVQGSSIAMSICLTSSRPCSKRMSLVAFPCKKIESDQEYMLKGRDCFSYGSMRDFEESFDHAQEIDLLQLPSTISPFFGGKKLYRLDGGALTQRLPPRDLLMVPSCRQSGQGSVISAGQITSSMLSSTGSRLIGQVDNKFIALACVFGGPSTWMIILVDQHAASERARLDCLMTSLQQSLPTQHSTAYLRPSIINSITLDDPIPIFFTLSEAETWERSRESCESWGWRIGDGMMSHVPLCYGRQLGVLALRSFLSDMGDGVRGAMPKDALEILKSKACRSGKESLLLRTLHIIKS